MRIQECFQVENLLYCYEIDVLSCYSIPLTYMSPCQKGWLRVWLHTHSSLSSEAAEEIATKHSRYTCERGVLLWPFSLLPRSSRKRWEQRKGEHHAEGVQEYLWYPLLVEMHHLDRALVRCFVSLVVSGLGGTSFCCSTTSDTGGDFVCRLVHDLWLFAVDQPGSDTAPSETMEGAGP